jgi:hypothetical protein
MQQPGTTIEEAPSEKLHEQVVEHEPLSDDEDDDYVEAAPLPPVES